MKHLGNFHESSSTDLAFGTVDSDKAISVEFEHTRSLSDRQFAYVQCAVLYTTVTGLRRVRTINLALQVGTLAGSIFRYGDMDTLVTHMIREGPLLPVFCASSAYVVVSRYIKATVSKNHAYP